MTHMPHVYCTMLPFLLGACGIQYDFVVRVEVQFCKLVLSNFLLLIV